MARIREKHVKDIPYYSIVTSARIGPNKVPHEITLEYIGNLDQLKAYALSAYLEKNGTEAHSAESDSQKKPQTFKSYSHGACYAMYRMGHYLGIDKILEEEFASKTIKGLSRGTVLLLAIIHRAVDPGSMSDFPDWFKQSSLPYHLRIDPNLLTPQDIWEAMDGITEREIDLVQKRFVLLLRELYDCDLTRLHLDYTNYYTFIDSHNGRCTICKRGHNKQKRDDLRQFSLALITTQEMPVPMIWEVYDGNRNDKSEFEIFVERVETALQDIGCEPNEVTLTFDGGSNSEENFSKLHCHFICAHTMKSQEYAYLYDIDLDQYETIQLNTGGTRKAYRIDGLVFSGVKGTGILTFSEALKKGQLAQMEKDIQSFEQGFPEVQNRLSNPRSGIYQKLKKVKREHEGIVRELQEENANILAHNAEVEAIRTAGGQTSKRIRQLKDIPSWNEDLELRKIVRRACFKECGDYLETFILIQMDKNENGQWSLQYKLDEKEKAEYIARNYGKKLTVTDHMDWTTEKILSTYAEQACIENLFRTSKNVDYFSVRPQYHWTDDKIRVHVLVCMTALMIAEVLRQRMSSAGITISKPELMEQLGTIHDGWLIYDEKNVDRVVEDLDDQQKKLWEVVLAIPDRTTPKKRKSKK